MAGLSNRELWAAIEAAGPRPWARGGSESVDSDEAVREEHARRRTFIAHYGYAVPTREAIRAVAGFLKRHLTLEVCAGLGLWARLLHDEGVSIVSTDAAKPHDASYVSVEQQEAVAAVATHGECDALFICWPPDRKPAATRALLAFNGSRLVYVGDERFTGTGGFHEVLYRDWRIQRRLILPSWPGLTDAARLYLRKTG